MFEREPFKCVLFFSPKTLSFVFCFLIKLKNRVTKNKSQLCGCSVPEGFGIWGTERMQDFKGSTNQNPQKGF